MKDIVAEYGSFLLIGILGFAVIRVLGLMLTVLCRCGWAA